MKITRETSKTGLRPYRSLEEPQNKELSPRPIIAIDKPIWVIDGVVWNSRIIAGMVGVYMSFTKDDMAPMQAMKIIKRI